MLVSLGTCWIIKDMDMVALLLGNGSITRGLMLVAGCISEPYSTLLPPFPFHGR